MNAKAKPPLVGKRKKKKTAKIKKIIGVVEQNKKVSTATPTNDQ